MKLPSMIYGTNRRKQQVIDFRGINYSENNRDGEMSHTNNLSSDYFPCLAPRLPRAVAKTVSVPNGIYAGDDLFIIDGRVVYRNGEMFAELDNADDKRKMVIINSKLVIFPDKVYLNLDDKQNYIAVSGEPYDWETNYKAYFTKDNSGDEFISVSGNSAPVWVGDRYYRYQKVHPLSAEAIFGGGTFNVTAQSISYDNDSLYELYSVGSFIAKTGSYYEYTNAMTFNSKSGSVSFGAITEATTRTFDKATEGDVVQIYEHKTNAGDYMVFVPNSGGNANYAKIGGLGIVTKVLEIHHQTGAANDYNYVKLEIEVFKIRSRNAYTYKCGFEDVFRPGDAIKISGLTASPKNNKTIIVRSVTGNTLTFDENSLVNTFIEPGEIKLEREVPEFETVCEYNNRLFGADKEKIYASALGDPGNWNTFDGLSTDSYQVAVASAGKFTGCIGYSGSVLFFKEDMMYKLMGDYPANFAMYNYNVAGVKEGSEKSLANINESILYHGEDGVYAYTGSIPQLISAELGSRRFDDAVATDFGAKYYISMKSQDSGAYELYTYDTTKGIWLREDESNVVGFAEHNDDRLMLLADGRLLKLDSGDEVVSWSAETCEISEYIDNRKCYSRLVLRLDMNVGSSAEVAIQCDRSEWKTVWHRDYGNTEGEFRNQYTANIPIRPTRCDRFKIRISGVGKVIIRGITRDYEVGSEV